jgi:hypothetical protein
MAYVSRFLCSKIQKNSNKINEITKKGNLMAYVSGISCAKNSEKS